MKPVYYAGVYADLGLTDIMSKIGFFSSLSFKAGIPGESGIMEDRDWKSTYNNALTHYSRHTNRTLNFFFLFLALGGSFPVKSFYIKPFISGSWMQFAFTGSDGFYKYANEISYGIYEPIENSSEKPLSGDLISYRQDWLILAAGLSVGSNILYPFLFEFSFQITHLNFCMAVDNHLYANTDYNDYTRLGLFIEPRGNISLTTEKVKFSFEAAYRHISPTEGDSYINNTYQSPSKAGAGLSIMDYQFIVKYIF
jgi:outer membrane protease